MNIVHAVLDHMELLVPLFDSYRQFYGQDSDLTATRFFLGERLRQKDSILFLAYEEEAPGLRSLGFLQLYPSFSSVTLKRLWILNDLFVIPSARKQGVARALMERAMNVALETKSKGLVLETATDNHAAQGLYKKLGWKKDVEFDRYYYYF